MAQPVSPKIYSADPEALKRAEPKTLNEAQRAYRDMLLRQDAERYMRPSIQGQYLYDLGEMLRAEALKQLPAEDRPAQSHSHDRRPISRPVTNSEDIFSDE